MTILVEICVDSIEGLDAAIAGGAARIELCSALSVGGLTPSPGLMRAAAERHVPIYAMIRPRDGDFLFETGEIDQMRGDIDAVRHAGLAGVVLGASLPGGALDEATLRHLLRQATGLGTTLHRAFDLVPDPDAALELAVSLGFERILTSGGKPHAVDGLPLLRHLADRAGDRISVMPGSGVRAGNATQILRDSGAREIHASCRTISVGVAPEAVALGFALSPQRSVTSEISVRDLVSEVRTFELGAP